MKASALHRRAVLGAIGALMATPAFAQSVKPVIGVLMVVSADPDQYLKAFRAGLKERGYVEGQNFVIEVRKARSDQSDLPALAAELVALKVDVIVAVLTQAVLAAKAATKDIPIVAYAGDMLGSGLAASLARPGGNITGVTSLSPETSAVRVDLLRQIVPGLRRLGLVYNEVDPLHAIFLDHYALAGKKLGIELAPVAARPGAAFEPVFARVAEARVDAMWIQPSLYRKEIADLLPRTPIPAMGDTRWIADNGGLLGMGAGEDRLKQQLADFTVRILKGAKPADLPIQQPVKFELVINARTAARLGLTIPPLVIGQADEVIE